MKLNRSILISLVLLIIVAALYRIIPSRPLGFVPHIAMALFGGAMIKDRKWAFALPIFSMFLSDALYELLYRAGMSDIQGFYEGQLTNYILFAGLTLIGFAIRKVNIFSVALASLVAPTVYFLLSNFFVWVAGAGFQRPKTFGGLLECYADGLPFYRGNLVSTIVFCAVLFGGYYMIVAQRKMQQVKG
jgi:hypothetical protein